MKITLLSLISLILVEGCSGAHPSHVSDVARDTHETMQPNSTNGGAVGDKEDNPNIMPESLSEKTDTGDILTVRDPLNINSETTEKLDISQSARPVENHRTNERENALVNETQINSAAAGAELSNFKS